jgi:hypothetical protein
MRVTIMFSIILIFSLVIAFFIDASRTDPPKEWWRDEMTIRQIENEHEKEIELQIATYRHEGFFTYDRKKKILRSATKEEIDETIKRLQAEREMKSQGWIQLKSLYKDGDKVRKYQAPPLTGSVGYILVRGNKVIFKYHMAIQ